MCGFTGFVSRSAPDVNALHAMGDTIRHRGPDDEGYFADDHCAIAHRRLSIIDLTEGSRSYVTWILEDDGRVVDKVEFSDNKITKRK